MIAEDETSTFVSHEIFDARHRCRPAASVMTARAACELSENDHDARAITDIDLQIMWNRLIAVVEEQAQVLLRTAFSPIVREAATSRPACSTSRGACWRRR